MDKNKYHVATNQVATDTTIETAMYSPYSSPQSNTFSDTSSEFQSDDKINQKFDNFKIAIRQLQKEVQTERVKNQGLTTIISSSKETKEENSKLRKDMQIKESAIAVLQNRLSNLGESTEVRLKDGEHVIPGPSRQILDSLTEENCKLKESLRYMTVDPSHIGQLQKAKNKLERQCREQSDRLQYYEQENTHLKQLLTSSDNLKDNELLHMKQKIEELQQYKDSQNILCQSLTDETETLRLKLRETAAQCQDLESKLGSCALGSSGTMVSGIVQDTYQQQGFSLQQQMDSRHDERDQVIERLKSELTRKAKELTEIVEMNSRWQKYNAQREEYVQKLHHNLKATEEKLSMNRQQSDGISEEQQAEIDRIILQCKRKVELVEEDKEKIEDENRHLLVKCRTVDQVLEEKDREIDTLRQHVQALSNQDTVKSSASDTSDKERIEILEHQIKICTDDFQQERQDREQAMAKIVQLENELEFHKRQLFQFHGRQMEQIAQRRSQALNNYQQQHYQQQQGGYPHYQHGGGMIPRGGGPVMYEADGPEDDDAHSGEDVIDGDILRIADPITVPQPTLNKVHTQNNKAQSDSGMVRMGGYSDSVYSKPQSVPADMVKHSRYGGAMGPPSSTPKQDDMLQCPKCHLAFPSQKHFDLLDHINDCC